MRRSINDISPWEILFCCQNLHTFTLNLCKFYFINVAFFIALSNVSVQCSTGESENCVTVIKNLWTCMEWNRVAFLGKLPCTPGMNGSEIESHSWVNSPALHVCSVLIWTVKLYCQWLVIVIYVNFIKLT